MNSASNDNFVFVKNKLHQSSVNVPDEWLTECIKWILCEYDNLIDKNEIYNYVYEQWLLADLRELGIGNLPNQIRNDAKFELCGCFSVQVLSIKDVSISAYSQLQKIKGTDNENATVSAAATQYSWDPKPSRMLMIEMTDGCMDISGMEYRPLKDLTIDTIPGTKLLLHGIILCRHGVLMLSKENVTILGGEVESLSYENSQIRVLAKTLNVEIEDYTNDGHSNRDTGSNSNRSIERNHQEVMNTTRNLTEWQIEDDEIDEVLIHMGEPPSPSVVSASVNTTSNTSSAMESDIHVNYENYIDEVMQEEFVADIDSNSVVVTENGAFMTYHSDVDVSLPSNDSDSDANTNNRQNRNLCDLMKALNWPILSSTQEIRAEGSVIDSVSLRHGVSPQCPPFTYLIHIENSCTEQICTYRVKAYISTLLSKLDCNSGQKWTLTAKINDGSASVDVDLSDEFLADLIGYTAQETYTMRKDPAKKLLIATAVKECQKKLVRLSAILELEQNPNKNRMCIKRQFRLSELEMKQLISRLT